jgi:H+/Cl- antiporter ClcA
MPPASSPRRRGDRWRWLGVVVGLAVALGAVGALVTVGFIKLLEWLIDVVWTDLADALGATTHDWWFVLPVCAVGGGVAVGLCARFLGDWPKELETALADFRRDRVFDYRHLPNSAVASLAALVFGAALGPEAALVALIGGLCSWIGRIIGVGGRAAESLQYVGVMAALGTLFGTAGAAAIPLEAGAGAPRLAHRLLLLVPGAAAAGTGALIFSALSAGDGYLDFHFRAYDLALWDVVPAVAAAAAGAAVAALLLLFSRVAHLAAARLPSGPVFRAVVGGIGLGVLGSISALVLFSGHEGIQELIDDTGASTAFLVGIAVAKVGAIALLLATGWRGGRFFPMMFAGTAGGLAVAAAFPEDVAMVCLAAGMTAAVAAMLRRPLAAGLLMLFLFPYDLYPTVAIAAVLGAGLGRVVARPPATEAVSPG